MRTLASYPTSEREWATMKLRAEVKVIGWGKTHIGFVEYVRRWKEGDVFSAAPFCNGNGQHVGNGVREELDTDAVTCKRCIAVINR